MRRRILLCGLIFLLISGGSAAAQNRVIVRDSLGLPGLQFTCFLLGCNVIEGVDGTLGQVFVVAPGLFSSVTTLLSELLGQLGIVDAELGQVILHDGRYLRPLGVAGIGQDRELNRLAVGILQHPVGAVGEAGRSQKSGSSRQ